MKIGLSYSRCVHDIVTGKVDVADVLIIIARTMFDPTNDDQWSNIWNHYRRSEWYGVSDEDEKTYRDISIVLLNDGKLHQPRKFGAVPARRSEFWLDAVLPSEELEKNPVAKEAWDKFQTIAGLVSVSIDHKYQ
jgi:hypothetical protein